MKKILFIIIATLCVILPTEVFADGYVSASPSSLSIEVGTSKSFTITAFNVIGDVSISSNNSGVASVSTGFWSTGMVDERQTKSGSITVTGNSVGTAVITLYPDAACFDGYEITTPVTVTVNVYPKPTPAPNPTPPSNNNNNNNYNNQPNNNNNKPKEEDKRSTNTNLKSISVDGFDLVKVDKFNYNLAVTNDIENINVKATVEDNKSKVSGTGNHNLNIGENVIELVVTSERGTTSKYTIKVNRKDGFYIEDLDKLISSKISSKTIILKDDTKISSANLNKVKESKQTIAFTKYDDNKKELYSWILDGSKIKDFEEIFTKVNFESKNKEEVSKYANYADGIYLSLEQISSIPEGTKLRLYVGNKYNKNDKINVYYYNKNKKELELVELGCSTKDGYIEFNITKGIDYLLTKATITNKDGKIVVENNNNSLLPIIIIVVLLITTVTLAVLLLKKNKKPLVTNDDIKLNEDREENVKVDIEPISFTTTIENKVEADENTKELKEIGQEDNNEEII